MAAQLQIGFVIFKDVTQLDFTGPFEVFAKLPNAKLHVVAQQAGSVRSDSGLHIVADTTFATCPPLDVVCVPGGPGVNAAMEDAELLAFLRAQHAQSRYTTSVCTGALVLGAAGILCGIRATTHWASLDMLPAFGAVVPATRERVVIDGKIITGGGVTAGIDFALVVAAQIAGEETAELIQLMLEYAPHPPYNAGEPETAPAGVDEIARTRLAPVLEARRQAVARAAARLPPC
eukprot:m.10362 g.10362  ORF g.10362 m.10362 type:complete len:233 (-) comp2517_c0_seq1:139-837(-)